MALEYSSQKIFLFNILDFQENFQSKIVKGA